MKMGTGRRVVLSTVAAAALLTACAEKPMGPTVQVMPGSGKSFASFQNDQAICRSFAEQSVSGQARNANLRGAGAGLLTTGLGAGLGAAIGGGSGAGIGAAAGALGGTAIGATTSSNAQRSIQAQYPADGIVENYLGGSPIDEIADNFEIAEADVRNLLLYAAEQNPAIQF